MPLTDEQLEILEWRYLTTIHDIMLKYLQEILERFYLRLKLYNFWKQQFTGSEEIKRLSDLGVGAERVFHSMFAKTTNWSPSSIPVGSNLFYECDDAFMNIDVKSVYVENSWDYLGVAEVGERQTSYPIHNTGEQRKSLRHSFHLTMKSMMQRSLVLPYLANNSCRYRQNFREKIRPQRHRIYPAYGS